MKKKCKTCGYRAPGRPQEIDRKRVKELMQRGFTQSEVARKLKTSRYAIWFIVKGKRHE